MTNFIFKSPATFKKISNQLETILTEQRHQRADLQEIKFMLHKLVNNNNLQETVDKFYKEAPGFASPNEDGDI